MAIYRTAQGKMIDMGALLAKNERTRAVGNMKVNARGDTIDDNGNVIVPVTEKVGESYQRTVGNRSAQVKKTGKTPRPTQQSVSQQTAPQQLVPQETLTQEEQELLEQDDIDIEQIKAQESKKR